MKSATGDGDGDKHDSDAIQAASETCSENVLLLIDWTEAFYYIQQLAVFSFGLLFITFC